MKALRKRKKIICLDNGVVRGRSRIRWDGDECWVCRKG
jgi:hypothetical protein